MWSAPNLTDVESDQDCNTPPQLELSDKLQTRRRNARSRSHLNAIAKRHVVKQTQPWTTDQCVRPEERHDEEMAFVTKQAASAYMASTPWKRLFRSCSSASKWQYTRTGSLAVRCLQVT